MNILIINPLLYTPPPKGAAVQKIVSVRDSMIINYALGFKKLGHEVTVLASEEYKPLSDEDYGIELVFLPNKVKRYIPKFPNGFPILSGLHGWMKTEGGKYDLIISSEAFTYTSFVAARLFPEKTVIWQEIGQHMPTLGRIPSKLWHNTAVRFLMKKALFVPRSETARKFIAEYAENTSKIFVEHGVNQEYFIPTSQKSKYFVVIAQLIKRKNISLTIDKFARFLKEYRADYKLYILGKGEEEENLRRQIAEYDMANKIILCGFKTSSEVAEMLRNATALLIDTKHEFSLITSSEAIACGTPVITNSIPYTAYCIKKYDLGIVDDNWSGKDMMEVIEHNEKYVANCIEYADKLSYTYLAQKMIDIARANHRCK